MSIPKAITIKSHKLPPQPGVYLFKNKKGKVVYVGKATNLKSRVSSYWSTNGHSTFRAKGRMGRTIDEMLHEVVRIDWITTDSVIEALILEANLIKKHMPAYNVKEKDDKSFLYVVITKEDFPKVQLIRGSEIETHQIKHGKFCAAAQNLPQKFLYVFGPYTSAGAIRAALDLIRKWFPWAMCKPPLHVIPAKAGIQENIVIVDPRSRSGMTKRVHPCFEYQIGRCPGVCIGAVSRREYMKNIRNVILMLDGKKTRVLKNVEREMKMAAKEEQFEEAEKLRRKLFALQHIRDIAVITREVSQGEEISRLRSAPLEMTNVGGINIRGRIEGYDISNISGTSAVGSMVVFQDGAPDKSEYRKFKIKTVNGINDVAMMREVIERRFRDLNVKKWGLPDLLIIDGGWGQVNAVASVLRKYRLTIPIVGIAKGFDRKQDCPIFNKDNPELSRIVASHKDLLLQVRDEAHRFAVTYHRKLRSKRALST